MKLLKISLGTLALAASFASQAVMTIGTQTIKTDAQGRVVGSQNITVNTYGLGIGTALGAKDAYYSGVKDTSNILSSSALAKAMSAPLAPCTANYGCTPKIVTTTPVATMKLNPMPQKSTSNLIKLK